MADHPNSEKAADENCCGDCWRAGHAAGVLEGMQRLLDVADRRGRDGRVGGAAISSDAIRALIEQEEARD